jgi:hypothetical protein
MRNEKGSPQVLVPSTARKCTPSQNLCSYLQIHVRNDAPIAFMESIEGSEEEISSLRFVSQGAPLNLHMLTP